MQNRGELLTTVVVFFILLFVFAKFGPGIPISQTTQTKGEPLVVQGTGKVAVTPDIAKLMAGIEETGASLKNTQNSVNQKSKALTDAMKQLGIAERDIKTVSYNIYPETENVPVALPMPMERGIITSPLQPMGSAKITRYRVSTTYEITIRDFDKVNDAITSATQAGANIVGGVSFDINDDTKNKKLGEAREAAVKEAKQKADSLAKAAGVSLGKLLNISESGYPRPYPMSLSAKEAGMGGGVAQPDIQPGETEIAVTVSLSFDIR